MKWHDDYKFHDLFLSFGVDLFCWHMYYIYTFFDFFLYSRICGIPLFMVISTGVLFYENSIDHKTTCNCPKKSICLIKQLEPEYLDCGTK
jgi:hypothetical protein